MEVSSSAFKGGEKIPIQYVMPGAGGKNISVPLSWKNVPSGTKSFALSMVDPHPVAQNWVHWLVINIPADTVSIGEGASRRKMPPELLNCKVHLEILATEALNLQKVQVTTLMYSPSMP